MQVELGTPNPTGRHDDPDGRPVITYTTIPDTYTFNENVDTEDFRKHLVNAVMRKNGITNYEGGEALCVLTHPGGTWPAVSGSDPTWVWSDNPQMQRFLSEYYQVPEGRPAFVEETHWRLAGTQKLAPGVPFIVDANMLLVNSGCTAVSGNVGGGTVTPTVGTGTAATSTTLTTAITTTSTTQFTGSRIYVANTSGAFVFGNILSCTDGTDSVITVDQWYNPATVTNGGAAGTTPASGYYFYITDGGLSSSWYMGLTTTDITPAATDTALSGESTASGMARKMSTFTITSAASGSSITWTNSAVFTYGTSGSLTFYAMGLFPSIVKSATNPAPLFWETSFSGSFTVTNSGDQATVTDSISAS